MSPLLQVEDVAFAYEDAQVLRGVSFAAGAGEFIALVGTNGAGKSTLFDVLAGIRQATAGRVLLQGRELAGWAPRELARRVSHLPQALEADMPFTAEQLVAMGRYPHTDRWFESADDHRAIEAAMRRTGCWHHRTRRFGSLSGGERQRVLLAACMAQSAEVLLLDEPSTFLDIAAQLECFALLREQAQAGRLCLAVTHDLNLALTFCTRLLVLDGGRVARDLRGRGSIEDGDWLRFFSPQLRLGHTESGAPWVWYA